MALISTTFVGPTLAVPWILKTGAAGERPGSSMAAGAGVAVPAAWPGATERNRACGMAGWAGGVFAADSGLRERAVPLSRRPGKLASGLACASAVETNAPLMTTSWFKLRFVPVAWKKLFC